MATLAPAHVSAEHIRRFENKLTAARHALTSLPGNEFYDQLWSVIHRPGWTTPAETLFFEAAVDSLVAQAQSLSLAHAQLLAAAQQVGGI